MYTIKEAARRSGVTVDVARAWERRYGVVEPARSPSGYRLYDDTAVARLALMHRRVVSGWSPSEAARSILAGVLDEAGADAAVAAGLDGVPGTAMVGDRDPVGRLLAGAAALDASIVGAVLDEAFAVGSFEAVVERVVLPAMVVIGDEWAAGRLDVAAEHAATQVVMRRLGAAFDAAASGASGPRVLVGMVPGERHEVGALALAVALRRAGLDVTYLGADVPESSWREAVALAHPQAAVVGAVAAAAVATIPATLQALRSTAPGLVVAIGGRLAPDFDGAAGVVRLPDGIVAACSAVRAAVADAGIGQPPPGPRRPRP